MKKAYIIASEEPITLNDINNRYTYNETKCNSCINPNTDLTKSKDNYHFHVFGNPRKRKREIYIIHIVS